VLDNDHILRVWELGRNRHGVDQAILILEEAFPDRSWDDLVQLPLGERNDLLLDVREKTLGFELQGYATCNHCEEELEFVAETDEVRIPSDALEPGTHTMQFGTYDLRFRLLNSLDLGAVSKGSDEAQARRTLARRVLVKATQKQTPVSADQLPDSVIDALSDRLSECDPQAAMHIEMECPECRKELSIPFDIVTFFWREIQARAQRLLREVDLLARRYGWSEAEILSMSELRRYNYLELVAS